MINPSSFLNDVIFMGNPVLKEQSHRRLGWMLLSSGAIFTVKKHLVRILVHRSLLRARLHLISPTPRILEAIILEKCGTGPELFNDFRRERMRSNIAMLRRPKAGWDGVWEAAGTGRGDIPASFPGGIRDKEEFYRGSDLRASHHERFQIQELPDRVGG
jgi:hypothetical protein